MLLVNNFYGKQGRKASKFSGDRTPGRMPMKEKLINAIAENQEEEALKMAEDMLARGEDPHMILDASQKAMIIVGQRFEDETYFLPELIFAGETLAKIAEMVKPYLKEEESKDGDSEVLGTIVLGTVEGDIHDIGKDIVGFLLDVNNFKVYDLGIDVPIQKFVDKIKEVKPDIVALSGFLTLAYDAMRDTVQAIKDAGLRDDLKIMIGGGQMDDNVTKHVGADAYGSDATMAVSLAKSWVGGK
jgi:methanogenic corrinoid protein MtbC1